MRNYCRLYILISLAVAASTVRVGAQIRITEYMYQGANGEFVEFTNVGGTAVDLTGWSFDDNSNAPGSISLSAFGSVAAGESVIVTESGEAAFRTAWGLSGSVKIIGGTGTLAALGRNDTINIWDASNTLVDRLQYGDQDFAGSIRTQNVSGWICTGGLGQNNAQLWVLSALMDGQNSVASTGGDLGSPGSFVSVACPMGPTGACCTSGICSDGITQTDCETGGGIYQGDASNCGSVTCPQPSNALIRITEYMYASNADGEFVELTNTGATPIDLTGWSLDDNTDLPGSFDLSAFGTVASGESVIVTDLTDTAFRTAWSLPGSVKVIGGAGAAAGLGRNDKISIWDASNTLVDRLQYGDEDFPGTIRTQNSSGWVCDEGIGLNDPTQWFLSSVADIQGSVAAAGGALGNPGTYVSVACSTGPMVLDTVPGSHIGVAALPSVSVTFNTAVSGVTAGGITVNGSAATNVTGSGAGPYVFTGYAAPANGNTTISMASGSIVSSPGGVPFAGYSWSLSVGIRVVINELNYHPSDTLDASQTSEFLELYNLGASAVDLTGWTTSGVTFTFPNGTMLAPGGYLVVAVDPAELQVRTGYAGALQWTSGALSNSGEAVSITDNSSNVIDSVTYSDGGAWPSAPDGNGPSLELINPGLPNQYPISWKASIGIYGTPGAQNSTFVAAPAPLLISPMHSPSIPAPSSPVQVTVTALDDGVSPPNVTLLYRQDAVSPPAYSSTPMFDDGAHGDGAAGDDVFGVSLPGLSNGEQYDFYITADDGSAVSTFPPNHPSANASCSGTGCQTDQNPSCIVCQRLLCKFSNEVLPTDFPVYHVIVSRPNKATQEALSCNTSPTAFDPCKSEFDATFVDETGKVYYNILERYRGQSSIVLFPRSYAIDFPSNNQLLTPLGFPVRKLILNANNPTRQKLGFDIFGDSGLPTSRSEFIRLRFTGINYDTTNIGSNGFNGLYACIERVDNDMLDSQDGAIIPSRGLSSDGNLYRGENTANLDWRGSAPGPYRVNMWGRNGYSKENNEELDDFTDLINLCNVMNNTPAASYAATMADTVDEDEWCRYFAIHNILSNKEGGIYRDTGDDYYIYFNPAGHPDGYGAKFITWDTDSILREGYETIWRTGNNDNTIASVRNFLRNNSFAPIFVKQINTLLANELSIANFNARIDAMPNAAFFTSGGSTNVPATKQQYKDWFAGRVASINNETIDALTLSGVPSSPYTNANPVIALSGQLNQDGTHNVTLNGTQVTFSVYQGTWSSNFTLYPGLNTITVKSFDRQSQETASITSTVFYDPPPATPGLRLTMPTRMVDSKTLTFRADILDSGGNIDWRTCGQLGTVSATRISDGSSVPTSITVFETLNGGAGGGTPPADSIRFYNGVGSVSITLDQGAGTPAGDILVTVTVGSLSASKIVTVLDGDNPAIFKNLSGTLSGANLTWGPSDGVIHLTGDVTVNAGNTLTILPGTLVMVDSGPVNNGTAINATGGGHLSALATRAEPTFFFPTAGPAAMVLPQNAQNNDPSWRGIYHQDNGSSTYSFVILTGAGNAVVASHPRPPILRCLSSHNLTMNDCVLADCPGMGTSALGGASGTYTFRRCLFSRVGIGGEWLGTGSTMLIEDSWFTRIGRAPEPNGVDGDILHVDRPGNTYTIRRSILTDCGDDMIDHSTGAQPLVENCIIYDCRDKVVSIGPLVDGPEATITMTNCLVFNAPGGIRCNGAPAILTNCTLGAGTNVNGQGCTATSIQRCILWTNSADTCCGDVDYSIVGNPSHLNCGTGNLSTNPLFVNTTCNYELQAGSPALTAGPSGDRIGWLGFPVPLNGCVINGDCDDGDACTADTCDNGICVYTPVPGCCHVDADCNDGSLCTVDSCSNNVCSNTPTNCDDGDACTTDSCDPQSGCAHTAVNCDDSNPCTTDSCDMVLGCQHVTMACPMGQTCNPSNGQCELLPVTVVFRDGLNGYTGTQDTYFEQSVPTVINGALETIRWDSSNGSPAGPVYLVLRFDNIFGSGPDQIPSTATIQSASLTYTIGGDANATGNDGDLREVLVDWDEATTTYNNFGGTAGVQAGDHTGVSLATMPGTPLGAHTVDVTSSLSGWLASPASNRGWIVLPTNTDGVQVRSSEYLATPSERPTLSVTFLPINCVVDGDCDDSDPCTEDACVDNACQNTPMNCDDSDDCTDDSCSGGNCDHTPIPGCCEVDGDCDDGSVCTTDACVSGICQNTPISCDDSDACTEDTCDAINGCQYSPTDCDDGDLCTIDSCNSPTGCVHAPVSCPQNQTCNPANGQCESQPVTLMYQDGVGGYDATVDTFIHAGSATADSSLATVLVCDGAPPAADERQVLLRFDNIFGNGVNQIPLGSTIQSASLTVMITNASLTGASLHRMTQSWLDTNNWNTFSVNGNGIQAGTECESAVDVSSFMNSTGSHTMDVTASLAAWSAGQSNNGWVWINNGDDSWQFNSNEFATVSSRPKLSVTFLAPSGCMVNGDCDDSNPCTDDVCNMGTCEYTNNTSSCNDGDMCTTGDVCGGGACAGTPVSCPMGQTCNPTNGMCEEQIIPSAGDVIIAGFQATNDPTGQNPGEFIELFNTTNQTLSLENMQIQTRIGSGPVEWALTANLAGKSIAPHSFFLIAETAVISDGSIHDVEADMDLATGEGGPNEQSISIELLVDGFHMDYVVYGNHLAPTPAGDAPGDLSFAGYPRTEVIRALSGTSFVEGMTRRVSASDLYAGYDVEGFYTDEDSQPGTFPNGVWTSVHSNTNGSYVARSSATGSVNPPGCQNDGDCDDGQFCNGMETCNTGTGECVAGGGDPCQPGEFCNDSTDSCDECIVDGDCDDGDLCNGTETCQSGTCQAGTPLVCDDDNFCNGVETCDSLLGCQAGTPPVCDDGDFCNGLETCDPMMGCVPGTAPDCDDSNPCTDDTCDSMLGCQHALTCTPTVTAIGPRYLSITPPAGQASLALRVESVMMPCLPKYVDASGYLVGAPVFQSSAAWGTVHLADREIIPSTEYSITADIRDPMDPENLTPPAMATTWAWGDVNNSGDVDIFDIVCVLDGFQDIYTQCALEADDLMGQTPDRAIDIFDIVAVLDGFQDISYPDPMPCGAFAVVSVPSDSRGRPIAPIAGASIKIKPSQTTVQAGALFSADVLISSVSDLRAYQLEFDVSGGNAGSLVVEGVSINRSNPQFAFAGMNSYSAVNTRQKSLANSLASGGVGVGAQTPRYLATVQLRATTDAVGSFQIRLRTADRSTLLDSAGRIITDWTSQSASIQVRKLQGGLSVPVQSN